MRKKRKRTRTWKASYTVETALLMGILIPILFGILWLLTALYERAVLQGGASEGVFIQNMTMKEYRQGQKALQELGLGTARLSLKFLYDEDQVTALGNAQAYIPGLLSELLLKGGLEWQAQEENSWAGGTKKIREICRQNASRKRGDSG